MTKFFDKKLEEELGTGAAVGIAGIASELNGFIAASNAIRVAKGQPTLEQQMAEMRADEEKAIQAGHAKPEDFDWEPGLTGVTLSPIEAQPDASAPPEGQCNPD